MEKTVLIDGKEVKFKCSAALPRIYRVKFGRDLFMDFVNLENEARKNKAGVETSAMEIYENIAYIMAKHADNTQPDSIEEWLDQFGIMSIYKIFPDVLELWKLENEQTVTAKKKNDPLTDK